MTNQNNTLFNQLRDETLYLSTLTHKLLVTVCKEYNYS
jgi:hypothetical protein